MVPEKYEFPIKIIGLYLLNTLIAFAIPLRVSMFNYTQDDRSLILPKIYPQISTMYQTALLKSF